MVLHYAALAADAGGVDAFLIGSELKSLTRVRSASGVYPAVNALVTLAADVKAILGSGTVVSYGADWTEYGAHVVDVERERSALSARPAVGVVSIDAVGIDYYAPLADWRDDGNQLDLALTDSPYRLSYLAGNLTRGEAYDWYYADDCRARGAEPHADHRRARQAVDVPAKGPLEFLVAAALRARRRRRACAPDRLGAAIKADLAHRDRLPGGGQGRQPAECVPRSEVVGIRAAVFLQRPARRPRSAPPSASRAGRARSGVRRTAALNPVSVGLWRPHDRARRHSPVDLGCAALSGVSGLEPMSGATRRTGRPATGSPAGSARRRSTRWSRPFSPTAA